MDERQIFKDLVLGKITYDDLELSQQKIASLKDKFNTDIMCRKCGEPVSGDDFAIGQGYWTPTWHASHAKCADWVAEEAYECQKIDSDCNDCGYFKRNSKSSDGIFDGHCGRFNKAVRAYPNFCSGHACFVHRKDMNEELHH